MDENLYRTLLPLKATFEGLKRLDDWEDSEEKRELLRLKKALTRERSPLYSKYLQYADPWGNEISLFEWCIASDLFKIVHHTHFHFQDKEILVSTVWLGLNHGFSPGVLRIFETMIFDAPEESELNDYQRRYATLNEAIEGHDVACDMVQSYIDSQGIK